MGPSTAKARIAEVFSSKKAFINSLKIEESPLDASKTVGSGHWTNRDLEPTPPEERRWNWASLPSFWFSSAFGATGWNVAASLIATGLTWKQGFISAILGCFICAIMVVLMARPGVKYHCGFPVLCRGVMGMWGSYFFIFIRAIVCIIWYGIQTFYAANFLSVCFRCMFGSTWVDGMPNMLPESAATTSKQLLCFFLIWLLQVPFLLVHPRSIDWLFIVKGVIMPLTTFGLFGWAMQNGTGLDSLELANENGAALAATVPLGWSIMNGINVIMGTLSPMLVNQPDMARYCQKSRDAGWVQGISLFVAKILILFLGLATTTSMQGAYGEAYWNLWDLLDAILDHHWTAASRTAIWLVSMSYLIGSVAVNLGANSLPFGADFTSALPKYFSIVRGQVLCAVLGVIVQPWQLLANATEFLSFLGSYNIFMAPLCSVWIVDYVYGRWGNVHVPSLYDGRKGSLYWFWSGVNWLGAFSWLAGSTMGIPGLVGQYQPEAVNDAALNMYKMGWLLTFLTAAFVYAVLLTIRKPRIFPLGCESESFLKFEWLANEGREGFFEGERPGSDSGTSSIDGVVVSTVHEEKHGEGKRQEKEIDGTAFAPKSEFLGGVA